MAEWNTDKAGPGRPSPPPGPDLAAPASRDRPRGKRPGRPRAPCNPVAAKIASSHRDVLLYGRSPEPNGATGLSRLIFFCLVAAAVWRPILEFKGQHRSSTNLICHQPTTVSVMRNVQGRNKIQDSCPVD